MEMDIKKKVLVFVPKFPVLSETFIDREISKMTESAVLDIKILSLEKGQGMVSPNLVDKVSYYKLNVLDLLLSFPMWFDYLPRILRAYSLLKSTPFSFGKIYTLIKAVGFARKIKDFNPDIIFVHFLSYPSTLIMLVSAILRIPYAISGHAIDILVEGEYLQEKAKTAKFIVICNRNAYNFVLNKLDKSLQSKVFLQFHGIDFGKELQSGEALAEVKKLDKPLIFNVGRLVEKKGQKYLIEASKILIDSGVDHYLYIAGGGTPEAYAEIMKLIADKHLESTVKILGDGQGVVYSEIEKCYLMADVVAFPGITAESGDADGIPNVLVEGAFYKVPMVSTDSGSTTDLIVNNETGLLVPQKDSQKLAEALKTVLQNKDLATKLTTNASLKAKELFDLNKNVKKLEELLCSTI